MPGGDGTGPLGMGPMSGWGRGFCRPFIGRRRFLPGAGYRGWMPFGGYMPSAESEKRMLKQQVDMLKEQIRYLEEQMGEIDSQEE